MGEVWTFAEMLLGRLSPPVPPPVPTPVPAPAAAVVNLSADWKAVADPPLDEPELTVDSLLLLSSIVENSLVIADK